MISLYYHNLEVALMKWTVPGTVLQIPRQDAEHIQDVFSSMFLGGGIVLSQVSAITGLEPYTVQTGMLKGICFILPKTHPYLLWNMKIFL